MFENRTYRANVLKSDLTSFNITSKETNLHIQADSDLTQEAIQAVLKCRNYIEQYISQHPDFKTSLVPINIKGIAPQIINEMINAGKAAKVGPMAAVAGAVAEYTGHALLDKSNEVIVENGGDIFIKSNTETVFTIYANKSPLSMKTGILIEKREGPYALCTSSGTVGHSISYGSADAVTILSNSASLADAVATSLANLIKKPDDIEKVINYGKKIKNILGIIIIKDKNIGLWGNLKLVKL
ncbi:MAG: UPF0280 family protein [Desulfobacteraceae bacterium]|nr:UPF0280 family protein [Desulfobacteraceae bacterium]